MAKPDIKDKETKPETIGKSSVKRFIKPRLSKKTKLPSSAKDISDEVPRITNETVEQHRKEVIKDGRKYTYPIINTPKRIVALSLLVGFISFLLFSSYTVLRLYRFNDYSDFVYNVTEVVPLPVARVGGSFVPYEDYLFELRRFVHYFESQQQVDFSTEDGQQNLKEQRERSIQRTLDNAYIKKLARQNSVVVSSQEVDAEIELLREQNKLGDGEEAFEDVLKDFWGWSVKDYRKSVASELLRQKVVAALDPDTLKLADDIVAKLEAGVAFEELVAQYSSDVASLELGGEYGFLLDQEGQNADPKVLRAAFEAEVGGISPVINTGYQLEIVKVLEEIDGDRRAAHISLNFADITPILNDLKEEQPASLYISID